MTARWLEPAVAVSPDDLARLRVSQPFKLNNVALKWIRDSHEHPPGHPTTDCVDLTFSDSLPIPVIVRNTGMDYRFHASETTPWSWRQMLAALSPGAKDLVLGSNPALGVTRMTCEPVPGSYDHKRWHAARHLHRPYGEDAAVPVWDFFVTRTDGTRVRFHTNYNNNKVEVATVNEEQAHDLSKVPKRGKGYSDGRGTYRRQKAGNYTDVVPCPQDNSGGGHGPAVAEERPGEENSSQAWSEHAPPSQGPLAPPPGLENVELNRSDGWRDRWDGWQRGRTDHSSSGWQHRSSRQRDWGSGWQDGGSNWQDQDLGWRTHSRWRGLNALSLAVAGAERRVAGGVNHS